MCKVVMAYDENWPSKVEVRKKEPTDVKNEV
jgi:hypothetical protein